MVSEALPLLELPKTCGALRQTFKSMKLAVKCRGHIPSDLLRVLPSPVRVQSMSGVETLRAVGASLGLRHVDVRGREAVYLLELAPKFLQHLRACGNVRSAGRSSFNLAEAVGYPGTHEGDGVCDRMESKKLRGRYPTDVSRLIEYRPGLVGMPAAEGSGRFLRESYVGEAREQGTHDSALPDT